MNDLLGHARVRELLIQASNAVRLQRDLAGREASTREVDAALDEIYRDLGQVVFALANGASMVPELPGADEPDPTAYTNEIAIDLITEDPYTDEIGLVDGSGVDDSVDEGPRHDGGVPRATLGTVQLRRNDPEEPMAALDTGEAPWTRGVQELREMLPLPVDFGDPLELAVEASRVQWAASELGQWLEPLPELAQVALLGMLAARARHLRDNLDVVVGPERALQRLRRLRSALGLPTVAGLQGRHPETGSWAGDARAWFSLLGPAP